MADRPDRGQTAAPREVDMGLVDAAVHGDDARLAAASPSLLQTVANFCLQKFQKTSLEVTEACDELILFESFEWWKNVQISYKSPAD